jgi:type VI secretion system protein ImpM
MNVAAFEPGCFGKLPVAADFIGLHSHSRDALALERWLQDGVSLARQRHGPRSDLLLRELPETYFILWWSDPHAPLIGVILPGRDRSGRVFPFSVFLEARSAIPRSAFEDWPLLFDRFLFEAAQVGKLEWQDVGELARSVDGLRGHIPPPAVHDPQSDLLGTTTVQSLIGGGRDRSRLVSWAASNVRTWIPSSMDRKGGGPLSGLRFPIPAADREGRAAASFWLGLLRRLLGPTRQPPNCFWTVAREGNEGHLDAYFDPVDSLGFLHLLAPEFDSDRLYPVEEGGSNARGGTTQKTDGRFARLNDPALTLVDALHLLAPGEGRDS